ncbi:MAG: protein kinase [Gemmatimonadota bacterium]|nr:protein kinase [Gemmatimonadota bacterium]
MSDPPQDSGSTPDQGRSHGQAHGHFEIVEPIGQGGMGVVYKAIDTQLDRTVALKFLPPFLSQDTVAGERFVAEARAASALDHPNICTVHEIGRSDDGQAFIAMSYYDGETLDLKMARGPLPLDEAVGYARQITQGLAKAHAAGIVHRDIKPANIMVTKDGIVKILDFGLAKLEDAGLTKSGEVLGTVKYMSPEHTGGDKVDPRTDLWSVGVLLYEMLAGQHPFEDARAAAIMYSILHSDPEPLSTLNPRVPEPVERIVSGCLVKDRDRRYQSATELLEDLDRHSDAVDPVTGPRHPAASARQPFLQRRGLLIGLGAVFVLAVLLTFPGVRARLTGGGGGAELIGETRYMAVLPLTSRTGEPDDDVLVDGLTYSLTAMLVSLETERESLLVVPASEIASQEIRSAGEARHIFGVNAVLSGDFSRDDTGRGVVRLELVQPDPIAVVDDATLPGPEEGDFQIEVRRALARLLGVQEGRVDEALAVNEPARAEAYAHYLQGLGYLRRQDVAGNLERAVGAFELATDEDPEYAVAYAGMCEAEYELFRATTDTLLSNRAIEHCETAGDLASDQASVLTSLGALLLQTGEPDRALRRLREAEALEPEDADVHRWLGRYYESRAMVEEAEAAYRRAIDLQPNMWIYHNELAVLHAYHGELGGARDRFEQMRTLTPDNYLAYNGLGFVSLLAGDLEDAKDYFGQSLERRANPIAYRNMGYLHIRENQWQDAIDALESGIGITDTDWYTWRWLGHARHHNGEFELARAAWQRVIDLVTPLSDVNPDEVDYRLGLAEANVMLGDLDEGQRHLQITLLRDFNWNYQPYFAGRIFEILGRRAPALQYLRESLEEGFDPLMFERDPWLEELRADPGWAAILEAQPR